jgi:TonB family protein
VRVTEEGAVDSVYVLESSGQAAFDSAAVHGALDLRFHPGRKDERRVAMWARLPVRFHLSDPVPQAGAMP